MERQRSHAEPGAEEGARAVDDRKDDPFTDLLTRLVRVPKEAIDRQQREYQKTKKKGPAKPKQIVPTGKKKAG